MTEQNFKTGSVAIREPFILNLSGTQIGDNWFVGSGAVLRLVRKVDVNV